jgi:hypothetical protein
MQIHVKRIKAAVIFASLTLPALAASAQWARQQGHQQSQGNPSQPSDASQPSNASAGSGGDNAANTTATGLDYFYNHRAERGTASGGAADILATLNDKIRATDILATPALDDAATGLRFKTYLGLPAVSDTEIKSYLDQMNQVTELLKSGSTFPAWKLLYSMSDYTDLDAGISREVAHRIEAIWNSGKTQNGLEIANAKLRDHLDTEIHNADMTAEDLHQEDLEEQAKQSRGSNSSSSSGSSSSSSSSLTNSPLNASGADPVAAEASILPQMSGALQRKMELTDEYLQTLEARANIKLNEIKEHKMDVQDQTDFASYIDHLYKTHRYNQVIIAADFYRALFNQDEYPVDMQNEVSSSLEINEQVNQSLEAFKFDAVEGRTFAASTELQTAFLDNEFHPGLQGLARDQKQRVGDYLAKIDVLKNQIESRVFEQVPDQVAAIQKLASDFDSTKPIALVNGVKLESELQLGKAKLLAQQGELTDAMKEFSDAAEEWPGNPDLQTASKTFFGTEDAVHQNTDDFDRDFSAGNFRDITTKAVQYGAAVAGDPARKQQLTDAITKVQKAEAAETEANMRVMNGDVDGAWETIEAATKAWPDDVKLNQMLASLSARCADFVSAIDKARDAQAKKEYGYSLTWYVNALADYPASTIATGGVDDVSKQILAGNKDTVSTQD